jgi:PKD repeat protein
MNKYHIFFAKNAVGADPWKTQKKGIVFISLIFILIFLIPGTVCASNSGNLSFSATVVMAKPVASFTSNISGGIEPVAVQFNDTSSGGAPDFWNWNLGDGGTSSLQNPVHVYAVEGIYTVKLTVTNGAGSSTKTGYNYISVKKPKPKHKPGANFTATPRTGAAPLTVEFTDISTNDPDTWNWNFGDHSAPSTDQNPVHIYTKPGRYTVTLHVSNAGGDDVAFKSNYIVITEPPLHANFTGSPLTGKAPLTVRFTDTSTGSPGFRIWRFGDNLIDFSFEQDPFHIYRRPGNYTVQLTVIRISDIDTETKSGYVTVAPM